MLAEGQLGGIPREAGLEGQLGVYERPLPRLIGRADDLSQVLGLLADPSVRLVTLSGRGGVGKTRLALEVARALDQEATATVARLAITSM